MDIPKRRGLSSFQIIVLGFAGVILLGALLLSLPVSSAAGTFTPFIDALFTATTSVCVTGLVVYDTATYWSGFGHTVILLLIQIGGMGVITVAAAFAMFSGRRIGLFQRSTMQEAVAAPKMSGIVRLTGFIIRTTLIIELLGAAVMSPVFCRDFGLWRGLWMALFHSVSAFCNAGIDLMGVREPFSSLTSYAADPVINVAIMLLIVVGGIGFLTWDDIRTNRLHVRRYRMQSKVILATTALLILLPAAYFFFLEFSDLPAGERVLASFFQSVTPRTAGFNTVDLAAMSEPGQALTIVLMLIGGSPGSTAGGIKVSRIHILASAAKQELGKLLNPRRTVSVRLDGHSIDTTTIRCTLVFFTLYIGITFLSTLAVSLDGYDLETNFTAVTSCISNVGPGLSLVGPMGNYGMFSNFSKVLLSFDMLVGRLEIYPMLILFLPSTWRKN